LFSENLLKRGMIVMKYKYKQFLYLIIFFLIVFLGFKGCYILKANSLHQHISINDVQSIVIRAYSTRIATPEETENIVKWFNSINNIGENPDFEGPTNSSSMEIKLKSSGQISILYPSRSNQDFEIQRYNKKGKLISYWGRQSNIKKILEEASRK